MPPGSRATYCGAGCRSAAYRRRRATLDVANCHNDDYGRWSEDCWGAREHPRPLIRATHDGTIALSCTVRLGPATDRLSLGRLRKFAGLWNPDRCSLICAHRSSVARAMPALQSCGDGTFHDLFRHDGTLGVHRPAGVFVESGNSCSVSKAKDSERTHEGVAISLSCSGAAASSSHVSASLRSRSVRLPAADKSRWTSSTAQANTYRSSRSASSSERATIRSVSLMSRSRARCRATQSHCRHACRQNSRFRPVLADGGSTRRHQRHRGSAGSPLSSRTDGIEAPLFRHDESLGATARSTEN